LVPGGSCIVNLPLLPVRIVVGVPAMLVAITWPDSGTLTPFGFVLAGRWPK
jgi:hypothetical protein